MPHITESLGGVHVVRLANYRANLCNFPTCGLLDIALIVEPTIERPQAPVNRAGRHYR